MFIATAVITSRPSQQTYLKNTYAQMHVYINIHTRMYVYTHMYAYRYVHTHRYIVIVDTDVCIYTDTPT